MKLCVVVSLVLVWPGSLQLADSGLLACQEPAPGSTLGRHLALHPGVEMTYVGELSLKFQNGAAEPSVREWQRECRVHVLGESPDGGVELARLTRRRKLGSKEPFSDPQLVFETVDLDTGAVRSLDGKGDPLAPRWFPHLGWPLDEADIERTEPLDVMQFGLQPGDHQLARRYSVRSVEGAATQRRIEITIASEAPVEVQTGQGLLVIRELSSEFVVDVASGRVVERRACSDSETHGFSQRREQSMRLATWRVADDSDELQELRRLRKIASILKSEPSEALAQLATLEGGVDAFRTVRDRLSSDARALLEQAAAAAARKQALDRLVGAEAPEFTLKTLAGEPFSLSQTRGKVVLLTFWGVG